MRIDARSLAENPWFQLCALVAVLTAGVMIYNLTSAPPANTLGNNTAPPGPAPVTINTPPPAPVQKSKTRGRWILDANGAPDSDTRELRVVAANLADGDIVTVRPGSYESGVLIAKNARFIGSGANAQAAVFRTVARNSVNVSASNVGFENLSLTVDSGGDELCALNCVASSRVELDRCLLTSKARFAGSAANNSVLNARDCSFQTFGSGCAVKYLNNARGELVRCSFTANRFGPEALNAAQVKISESTFWNNGSNNGFGNIMAVVGGQARLEVSQSQFSANPGAVLASEGGSLVLSNCAFHDNGVTGEPGNKSFGLIDIKSAAKATLTNLAFENNKQGIQVLQGSTVTMSSCHMTRTGHPTDNQDVKFLCNAIVVLGQNTSLTVNQKSVISGSTYNAFVVAAEANLMLEEVEIQKSGAAGMVVGSSDGPGSAVVQGGTISGNAQGVIVAQNSGAHFNNCQFLENNEFAIRANGARASVVLNSCAVLRNKGVGLWSLEGGTGSAMNCNFEGNSYGAQAGSPNKPDQGAALTLLDCTFSQQTQNGVAICSNSQLRQRNLRFSKGKNQGLFTDKSASVSSYRDEFVR